MLATIFTILSIVGRSLSAAPLRKMVRERTFIAVKPDGVQRGLVGEIIKRFEAKGFSLVAMKFMTATEEHLKKHYADLADKPFYPGLCKYMSSGPLVAMCWEGTGVVKTARIMMGETRPADSKPGTIRGDFCIEVGRNIIHGSDSIESANKEIALWFKPEEIFSWTQANETWIYELMEFFGDVKTECGLQTLNDYLQDRSYICGHAPSEVDVEVFSALARAPEEEFFHALRWYNQIKSFGVEFKLTVLPQNPENEYLVTKNETEELSEANVDSEEKNGELKCGDHDRGFDLLGSHNEEQEQRAARVREEQLQAFVEEKSRKRPITKSSVMLDVKLWDDATDVKALEEHIRSIRMDGLQWGANTLNPLANGVKFSILCTVEDGKVSIDDLIDKIHDFDNTVQSVEVAALTKI